ncbi:Hypothetical Protein FCC1311_114252 [Hondaea fermentalgiana]|uniref:Uncharacterized protein n=1 Tax=Hondaea fermentalgiana TaxID=2315210 RepID=A0A2R5GWJ2_9STRA|nr:Hypothetical Protein FCC1311_114252 [Hondaea fermentalgiana]|eukprot:GBG35202.1 Hypothetical Protein FCC1311_114252 [Hondaea fermentalgiana]
MAPPRPLLRLMALAATLALAAAARSCGTHLAADLSARNRFIASADEACIYEMDEAAVAGKVCIDTPSGATPTHAVLNDRVAFLLLERDDGSSQVVAYNEQEDGSYAEGAVAWETEGRREASMALAESLLVVIGDHSDGGADAAADIILAENSTCGEASMGVAVDVDGTAILALDGAAGNESAAFVLSRVDELDWELGGYYYYDQDEASALHAAGSFFVALTAAGDEIFFEDAAGAQAAIPTPSTTTAPTTAEPTPAPTPAAEPAIKPRRDAGPSALVWTLTCAAAAALVALLLVFAWHRRQRYQQHQKVSTVELAAQRAY